MGFFSALNAKEKHPDHDQEAGGNHNQHEQQQSTNNNFFSNIFKKKGDHEEARGNHEQHEQQPSKNLFSNIFGKRRDHEEGGGNHGEHTHQPNNFISRILHKGENEGHHFFSKTLNRVEVFLRVSTLIFLIAGIVVLIVDQIANLSASSFLNLISYRYIFVAIIIAQLYIILQIGLLLFRRVTGIQRGFLVLYFDFLGDKILTYLLATGAAAAFGASLDNSSSSSLNQEKTAASLVLIAFFFSALSSIISSHLLPKHAWLHI